MSGALSKRQQARNERTLQDLIKSVPGNNTCADCQARNPGWASWSLGIFLCMRCAALHRKLGTHITKVKSLSMDSWSNEQVENMKRVGNVASNRIYNPQNARPPIPIDVDEADSAMEKFIRQKYQERAVTAQARNNTGSTNSDDQPPPLPPKNTGSRFGLRSASSIFPRSSKSKREAEISRQQTPSPPRSKPSRIFGTSVASDEPEELEVKMAKLRDMGFMNDHRNMQVLKGFSGNLEKSIETLIRFGEGGSAPVPAKDISAPSSRSRTPMSSAGITINRTREASSPKASTNPWEVLDVPPPVAQPQSSQSTGALAQSQHQVMGNNPYQQTQTSNPFGLAPSQSQYNLNQAFQNMSTSPSQAPLFPHHTGGFPGPQPTQHQQLHQQSMTPPVPSLPQQYYPPVIYENPGQQPQQNNNYNPFMQQSQQPQQPPALNTNVPSNPYIQQLATPQSLYQSPIERSPQQQFHPSSPFYQNGAPQQQQQSQMNLYLNQSAQNNSQQQPQQQMNPFFQNSQPQQSMQQAPQQSFDYQSQQQQPQFQQYRQQTLPLMAQPTGKADKRSILDLYNYPQLAPTPTYMQQPQQQQQQQQDQAQPQSMPGPVSQTLQQPRSVSSPLSMPTGSRNPFTSSTGSTQNPGDTMGQMANFTPNQNGSRHVSQESMSVDAGGWTNGRHSPDAWGSISARSMR